MGPLSTICTFLENLRFEMQILRNLYILKCLPMSYATFTSDLDGSETDSQGARDFPHPSRETRSRTQPPVYSAYRVRLLALKQAGRELTSCCY
jgi:hypothetical protein